MPNDDDNLTFYLHLTLVLCIYTFKIINKEIILKTSDVAKAKIQIRAIKSKWTLPPTKCERR